MDNVFTNNVKFKGEPCIKMNVGRYSCLIAPRIGGNCIRLHDCDNMMELVNFDPKIPMKWIRFPSILCGMPSMLFPNRLSDGILKTSDGQYEFPINESKLNNYIHGFLHTREYSLVSCGINNEQRIAKTILEYTFDENDAMYEIFPLKFRVRLIYTLSDEGLLFTFKIRNLSDKMLPVGLGNHTSMRAPFVKHGKRKDIRIQIPATKRVELNERFLATGQLLNLSEEDLQYVTGDKVPVLQDIDNDMFELGMLTTPSGKNVHGILMKDIKKRKAIVYEFDDFYKYLILWNCGGNTSFFCPEPISWMINAPNIDLPDNITGYKEIAPNEVFSCWQQISSETF